MFVRFVITARDPDSDRETGILSALHDLQDRGELAPYEEGWFLAAERWLTRHLRTPTRFAWSTRPNAPARAISWLKADATEHLTHLRSLVALLEHKAIPVTELWTERPGYIVYDDPHQVVAMPFEHET